MDILKFLRRPAQAAKPILVQPVPGAYPYKTFPRGRHPTDAEVDAIMSKYEPAGKAATSVQAPAP